jgi:hypothetical protein
VGRTLLSDALDVAVAVAVGLDVAVACVGRTPLSDACDSLMRGAHESSAITY